MFLKVKEQQRRGQEGGRQPGGDADSLSTGSGAAGSHAARSMVSAPPYGGGEEGRGDGWQEVVHRQQIQMNAM